MNTNYDLTRQDRIVLALVARGWRNTAVARKLVISTRTVETHLYRIFDKLSVSSRTEAALLALNIGLISDKEAGQSEQHHHNSNPPHKHP